VEPDRDLLTSLPPLPRPVAGPGAGPDGEEPLMLEIAPVLRDAREHALHRYGGDIILCRFPDTREFFISGSFTVLINLLVQSLGVSRIPAPTMIRRL